MNPEDDCVSCFLGVVDSLTRTSLMKNIGRKKKKNKPGEHFPVSVLVDNFGLSPILQY